MMQSTLHVVNVGTIIYGRLQIPSVQPVQMCEKFCECARTNLTLEPQLKRGTTIQEISSFSAW